jgi:hypothetical protein
MHQERYQYSTVELHPCLLNYTYVTETGLGRFLTRQIY